MASGVWIEGHIPNQGFDDAFTALKPGGMLISCLRNRYWNLGDPCGYREKLNEYIDAGKIEFLKTKEVERGFEDGSEMFKKMTSTLFVAKKLA